METTIHFSKIKTEVMSYMYELLDVDTVVNLAMMNSIFRKPKGLNKNSIIIYLYIRRLMQLYTKECYCYLLSNGAFHKKINEKFKLMLNEDVIKGKVLAFIHIVETNNFDVDFHCMNFGENSDMDIFYEIFKEMPIKYKQMITLKIHRAPIFPLNIIDHLGKISNLEIVLDKNVEKFMTIRDMFNPEKYFFRLGRLNLKIGDACGYEALPLINNYFEIFKNRLTELIIESLSSELELDQFTSILEFNSQSLKLLKVKGGDLKASKSEHFFEKMADLVSLKNLVIIFSNFDEDLEKSISKSLCSMTNLAECVCSTKLHPTKDFLYKQEFSTINLGEYYANSNEVYDDAFFNFYTNNKSLIRFDLNFDNFDVYKPGSLNNLEKLSGSFPNKNKLKMIRIRSTRSSEEHFLKFIKNLVHLKNLKEIFLDIMTVSVEFLRILWEVVRDNPSIIRITNETWAAMSLLIEEYFIFYYDSFDESLLQMAETLCERNDLITSQKTPKEVKLIIRDCDLDPEDKLFDESIWINYPQLTENMHYFSIDLNHLPDEICLKLKYFLTLMPRLKILSLEKCELSDYGWELISQSLSKLGKLNELKLICTNVNEENCVLLLSRIQSNHFINIDFKGNEIGSTPLNYIFQHREKFSKIIRLKYYNYGILAQKETFELMEQFILSNQFIFTLELNQQSILKDLKVAYKELERKFWSIFLPY